MVDVLRKKSPRAPSMALDEALDRVMKAYDKDRLHPAPTEVVAQNLGYKSANNGSALSAIASLRYFGLLERPSEGYLAISKDVEAYKFAPDQAHKQALLEGFLTKPSLYADLLEKFGSGLPSEATMRYDLIQRGFSPQSADVALAAFKRSADFVGYFSAQRRSQQGDASLAPDFEEDSLPTPTPVEPVQKPVSHPRDMLDIDEETDRIPVRLPGGRRAWLLIPSPFFEGDKVRLKAQIDLLLTQDEEA
jgi:hypothetical protein